MSINEIAGVRGWGGDEAPSLDHKSVTSTVGGGRGGTGFPPNGEGERREVRFAVGKNRVYCPCVRHALIPSPLFGQACEIQPQLEFSLLWLSYWTLNVLDCNSHTAWNLVLTIFTYQHSLWTWPQRVIYTPAFNHKIGNAVGFLKPLFIKISKVEVNSWKEILNTEGRFTKADQWI